MQPHRQIIDWKSPNYCNATLIRQEIDRVFDLCHGCRRCFNLCDVFPRMFDAYDHYEVDTSTSFSTQTINHIAQACTLCDLCYEVKCPYTPPHDWAIDFPHLILRIKASRQKKISFLNIAQTDLYGKISTYFSKLINFTLKENSFFRRVIRIFTGIHPKAHVPRYMSTPYVMQQKKRPLLPNINVQSMPKVVLYATCLPNYQHHRLITLTKKILYLNHIDAEVIYPECCGMPLLEQGALSHVAIKAQRIATQIDQYLTHGTKHIIPLTPSCALMLKQEWPLLLPDDGAIQRVALHTLDLMEFIAKTGNIHHMQLSPLPGEAILHMACHVRAQHGLGQQAKKILSHIPQLNLRIIERCSGHGGTWGMMHENFELALKQGQVIMKAGRDVRFIASECPLAALHLKQGVQHFVERDNHGSVSKNNVEKNQPIVCHPIELLAFSLGLITEKDF